MKSVIQSYKTGDLALVESPPPRIRPGHALVRTAFSLISAGTEKTKVDTAKKSLLGKALARPDQVRQVLEKAKKEGLWRTWQAVADKLDAPTPLGYSSAGQILEVSGEVDGLRAGDWVACGGSTANHAEIVCVPKNLLARIPEGVAPDSAAFATLGAIALQGVRQAEVRLGEKVVVIGLGLVGLLTAQILRAAGCRVVGIDVDPAKIALAGQIGCDDALAAADEEIEERILRFTGGYGADATIITAGTSSNEPIERAGEITREKGRVVVVGAARMDIPREPYYLKEIDLRISRSYGPGRYDPAYEEHGHDYPIGYVRFTEQRNMVCFLELLQSGSIDLSRIITHRFPIAEAPRAYELITGQRKEPYLGIVLEYGGAALPIAQRVELRPQPMDAGQIVVGVIGAGSYATRFLLPAIRDHAGLSRGSVCTASGVTAEKVARKFGFASAESDPDAVIRGCDAVVIATRHHDHASLALRALRQGRPVFVEKPLAITEGQLAELEDALGGGDSALRGPGATVGQPDRPTEHGNRRTTGAPSLTVGFNRRFAPSTRLVREHFASVNGPKQILIRVNAGAIPKEHWIHDPNVGGGRLIGEGCHFVDLAVGLTGARVRSVTATGIPRDHTPAALWDDFSLSLALEDGSIATVIYTSAGDAGMPKERIEVSGGGRSAVIDDFRSVELWSHGRRARKRWWAQDKGQAAELSAWVEGLRTGRASIPLDQILNVHRACFAAIRSIEQRSPQTVA